MKKTVSTILIIAILITTLPTGMLYANPVITSSTTYVAKYILYALTLLGFKVYDSYLNDYYLLEYMSTLTREQYDDISNYINTYDSWDNVEIRQEDIETFLNIYQSIAHTNATITGIITDNVYTNVFNTTKDITFAKKHGQFYNNRYYYREYTDDGNWSTRLEQAIFGDISTKTVIKHVKDITETTPILLELSYENLKRYNLSYTYEYIYKQEKSLEKDQIYTKYYTRKLSRRKNGEDYVDIVSDDITQLKNAPFSGNDYYILLKATTLDKQKVLFIRYHDKDTVYSQGIFNMYIPYEIYKWRYQNFDETIKSIEVIFDNSNIVNHIKELFKMGKKIYADLTQVGVLDAAITPESGYYDYLNNKIVYPTTSITLSASLLKGIESQMDKINYSQYRAGTQNKYSINGYAVDTAYGIGKGVLEGIQQGINQGTNEKTFHEVVSKGIISLQKLLSSVKTHTQSQSIALEAINNMNFSNKNHKYEANANKNFLDKFPFCLPKDIHLALNIFSADSITPDFDFNLLGHSVKIQLSQFDGLANILRISITISFIVSLIVLTKGVIS